MSSVVLVLAETKSSHLYSLKQDEIQDQAADDAMQPGVADGRRRDRSVKTKTTELA